MLRSRPPRWSVRTAAGHALSVAAVVAVGLGLSTFRPALAASAPSAPSNAAIAADTSPIPVPQTAIAAGQIRVAEGMKHPQFGKFVAEFAKSAPPLRKLIKVEEVDRIGIVVLATDQVPDFDGAIVVTGKAPWDLKKMVADQPQMALEASGGSTVIREGDQTIGMLLDPKTLVFADKPRIGDKVVRAMTGPRHESLERVLAKAGDSSLCFATSGTEFFGAIVSRPNQGDEPAAMFVKPILEGQQGVLLKIDAGADLAASIEADYTSPEGAKNASKMVEAGLTILGNLVKTGGASAPKEAAPMINAAKAALTSAKVQAEGSKATVQVKVAGGELLAALGSAMASAQESSSRMVGANNLKQIALAMHNHLSTFNKFPAAAAPEGENKYPVSWRVRILPYVEQEALYREYRMDEPWDGPNNKKLLEKMPNIYKSPVNPSATETPYQVLVGERTIFPPGRGVGIAEIVDGTSNTILVVESAKTVQWTKPDDIRFPLTGKPSWGGVHKGGFNVAMADGSVRFISESIDLNVLVGLCTRDGGEVMDGRPGPTPTPTRRP